MPILLYGANGYTGELIASQAVRRGLRPILAGRNEAQVARVAQALGLPHRAFALDDPAAVSAGLGGVSAVLHCAGPFSRTARPMIDGCLRERVHYLDITGEAEVFEDCARRDGEARGAGVMILPGVGADVVPSDCLAAHLARRLPDATHLALGMQAKIRPSRGTAVTMLEMVHKGGLVRRDGALVQVPVAHRSRRIDFGRGPQVAVTIPWGDVSTAYHSTRIPNVEFYMAVPAAARVAMRALGSLGPLLGSGPVQGLLHKLIRAGQPGPTESERASGYCLLWGEASRGPRRVVSRLSTSEGYTLTAQAAVEIAARVLRGEHRPGFQTPSSAFGPDLVLSLPGCARTDEPDPQDVGEAPRRAAG